MNKSTYLPQSYVEALPLDAAARATLSASLQNAQAFHAIHSALGQDIAASERPDDAPLKSVSSRVSMAWPDSLAGGQQLSKDYLDRTTLKAMPPVKRSLMFPEAWRTNPIARAWDSLRGQKGNPRYATVEEQKAEDKWRHVGSMRRYVLLILTILQTVVATWYMKTILPYQGWTLLDPVELFNQNWLQSVELILPYILQTGILFLFAILFCWVSAGFWTALMGFLQLLIGRDKYSISYSTTGDEPLNPEHRTALIMPICNEDVERVFAGLRATWESVKRTGNAEHFDVYILSDSYDADIAIAEQKAWMELVRDVGGAGKIFYRRRRRRVKRKSGNIDDFCRRWGSNYSYMVVLDADSVMSGECLTGLVRMMEANPNAGIIQSSPKASGMDTLYARCQQFATRVYGPLFTAGLHFWQLGESHYWGHNAIIRVQPFIEHCALAPLPGEGSFAGSILSHDFVEAALMRRAGWGVWIAYDLPGSYEELPPNLLDELKRDRRWCHGNLMNFRLFLVKGMHPVHRAVFLTGVMSYLSAPLWFMFLALSTALQVVHTLMEPTYFLQPRQLFPVWPQWRPDLAIALFSTTLVLLFLPKLLSVVLIWFKGAKPYGGAFRLFLSLLLEMLFSVLLAPVRMLFHTVFVVSAFLGWEVVWNSPQRDDDATPWSEAFRRHGSQMLLGIVWAVGMGVLDLNFLWWLAPIVFSLILSPFVSVMSSRATVGLKSKRARLFLIPEEYEPPKELVDTDHYLQLNRERALKHGFMHALFNPAFNALATAMATSRHKQSALLDHARDRRVDQALSDAPEKLNREQRLQLISDPVVLARVHTRLWESADKYHQWVESYQKLTLNPQALPQRA
ncbi:MULTISPECIES: glucans biosynthesis glucosyltransferase MdoH [Pantoea]|jgi:Membrane glycosyltransferase|uniref:glucans biosynthesis glucosyltransferase MdoH n=1 Tax=Pantoea TaxID=53335 RepID=UPI00073E5478|nr:MULTISPECIES: glucans biosynthesis glucosyltransferase MdoH [Pantoea]KAA6103817.1 glucans biosynthesis glucosyltransferase MdoH [Pantoea sp. B_9]KAA6116028.1 glucans biosynthesis glucosyltransferase MdoH [Pantoea sp. B_10]MCT6590187.1 glucans biosynthesis glucosyltransferase MdoH [Pantoea dispersa]MCW0320600.1 Glucans biosynthesis glucosyltransferase H [Pantoea dispersa]MCW0325336.1 Glucans biosynthesis glucosyltransferase H [Pantoea dispersa]